MIIDNYYCTYYNYIYMRVYTSLHLSLSLSLSLSRYMIYNIHINCADVCVRYGRRLYCIHG